MKIGLLTSELQRQGLSTPATATAGLGMMGPSPGYWASAAGASVPLQTSDPSPINTNGPSPIKTNGPSPVKTNDPSPVKTNELSPDKTNEPSPDNTEASAPASEAMYV
uniref:Uncharacterized protein n=1 Tax=Fibrocapsa japonica TaxID=94617 RepID=A0A7S2XZ09_9STRA